MVIVKLLGVGNSGPYDYRGRETRVYVFRWDTSLGGHILRVPLGIWQANKGAIAHDVMDQRRMAHSMIVTLEMPDVDKLAAALPPAASATLTSPEMGATAQSQVALNVVGQGEAAATVAPASETLTDEQIETSIEQFIEDHEQELAVGVESKATLDLSIESQLPDKVTFPHYTLDGERVNHPAPLYSRAWDLLEKPMRLKPLAALLETDEETLKTSIQDALSTVELGHAGWVKRREPQA